MALNKILDLLIGPKRDLTLLDVVTLEKETEITYNCVEVGLSGSGDYFTKKTSASRGYLLVTDQKEEIQVGFFSTGNNDVKPVHNPNFISDNELKELIGKDAPTVVVRYKKITARKLVNQILNMEEEK